MVQDTGAAKGTGGVRPLGLPRPIEVRADDRGWPVAVKLNRHWVPVTVEDRWRIDDEWWREGMVSRLYFCLALDAGVEITLYCDLMGKQWFEHPYT